MSFAPAHPGAGYTPEPRGRDHTERDWLNFLPPIDVAALHYSVTTTLSEIYYTQLGDYGRTFNQPNILPKMERFATRLAEIEDEIEARNRARPPYEHLLPSRIPQSINI